MTDNNAVMIAALPNDGHGWRVDRFGEIAFPTRMIRRKQPSVVLHLSRVIDERDSEDHSALLNPDSTCVVQPLLHLQRAIALWIYFFVLRTTGYAIHCFRTQKRVRILSMNVCFKVALG